MNPEYAKPLRPTHSAKVERTGIDSTSQTDEDVLPAVEELRADVAAWADALQVQVAAWMEELRAEAVTWAEGLRAEAVARAGEFTARLAVEADAIATMSASVKTVNEATAAARTQTDDDAAKVRQELASLRSLLEQHHAQRASDVEAARAAQDDALKSPRRHSRPETSSKPRSRGGAPKLRSFDTGSNSSPAPRRKTLETEEEREALAHSVFRAVAQNVRVHVRRH